MKFSEKELKKIYFNVNNQPREFFIRQLIHFREVMCSRLYSIERKEEEFRNLAQAYLRCSILESDKVMFEATANEFNRRMEFKLSKECDI